jgi:hypothetical protein
MTTIKDYTGNALAITDEQVASDWQLGLCRAIAKAIINGWPAIRIDERDADRWGSAVPGGLNEHLVGARIPVKDEDGITTSFTRTPPCPITEIYGIEESSAMRYEDSPTFGPGEGSPITVITARVSCGCGRIVKEKASAEIRSGEFIAAVTNAEN